MQRGFFINKACGVGIHDIIGCGNFDFKRCSKKKMMMERAQGVFDDTDKSDFLLFFFENLIEDKVLRLSTKIK
jgi:hypothetical protein